MKSYIYRTLIIAVIYILIALICLIGYIVFKNTILLDIFIAYSITGVSLVFIIGVRSLIVTVIQERMKK